MKKIIISLITIGLLIPVFTYAAIISGWQATSTTQGWIMPSRINGNEQAVTSSYYVASSTLATSTFAGGLQATTTVIQMNSGRIGVGSTSPSSLITTQQGGTAGSPHILCSAPDSATGVRSCLRTLWDPFGTGDIRGLDIFENGQLTQRDSANSVVTNLNPNSNSYLHAATGNFGLGTTSPYAKLSVVGQAVAEYFTATTTTSTSTFAGYLIQGSSTPFPRANNSFGTSSFTALVQNRLSGNWGIGTSSPLAKLSILEPSVARSGMRLDSPARTSSAPSAFAVYDGQGSEVFGFSPWAGGGGIGANPGYGAMVIGNNCTTSCRFGEISWINRATNNREGSIIFQTAGSNADKSQISFLTGGTGSAFVQSLFLDENGRAGLNNTAPAYLLDVSGEANFTDAIRANGSAGTSGQLFTSSGGGVNTWTSVSALGITSSQWATTSTNTGIFYNYGNVSIGTTTQSARLNVQGDVAFDYAPGASYSVGDAGSAFATESIFYAGFAPGSGNRNYGVTSYRTVSGNTFYATNAASTTYTETYTSSTTFDPQTFSATPTDIGSGNYSGGITVNYEVYAYYFGDAFYRSAGSITASASDASSFNVNLAWTDPVYGTPSGYIIIKDGTEWVDLGYTNSFADNNTTWSFSPPSYPNVQYRIDLSWGAGTNATGYRVNSISAGATSDTGTNSISDSNTFSGPLTFTPVTPYVIPQIGPGFFYASTTKNVGIGTSSPYAKLSVVGEAVAAYFTATTSTPSSFSSINLASTSGAIVGQTLLNDSTAVGNVNFGVSNTTGGFGTNIAMGSGNTATCNFLSVSGNCISVGISNSVTGTTVGSGAFGVSNTISSGAFSSYAFGMGNTVSASQAHAIGRNINNSIANTLMIGPTDETKFTIAASGNVGFGTTSPYSKFSVWGTTTSSGQIFSLVNNASTTLVQVLDSGNFGIGTTTPQKLLTVAGTAEVKTGLGTTTSQLGGIIFATSTDASSQTTVETDIFTRTIGSNTLGTNNDSIEAKYTGTFVGSGTATRQVRAYFGGTLCFDTGAVNITSNSAWVLSLDIQRVSSTVVRCSANLNTQGASLSAYTGYTEITGLSLAGNNILKVTGTAAGVGAATGDITAKIGKIKWMPAGN